MTGLTESYLGFDYSQNKIGLAVGQSLTGTASPLSTLPSPNKLPDWPKIDEVVAQWRPAALIVGLPLNMDGSEQETTQTARDFGKQLEDRYNLPVHFIDERLSSREASHQLGFEGHTSPRRRGKSRRKASDIDKVAAQIILQSWLNENT